MCQHDSKHTFGERFIGPARCGLPFLNMPAGPLLPNLGSKGLFPISRLCYPDRPAPRKSLSLATVGDTQSSSPSFTSRLLSVPLIAVTVPINPASNRSKRGDFYDSLGARGPLTKVKASGAEYQYEGRNLLQLARDQRYQLCSQLLSTSPSPCLQLISVPTPHSPAFPLFSPSPRYADGIGVRYTCQPTISVPAHG